MKSVVYFAIFLIVLLVLAGGVLAQESNTKTDFDLKGCDYGKSGLASDSCSPDGRAYCSSGLVLQETLSDTGACLMGKGVSDLDKTQCCPVGYICNEDGDQVCKPRSDQCESYTNEGDCKSKGCFFSGNKCVDRQADNSCSGYLNKDRCDQDPANLGSEGIGTEVCGRQFSSGGEDYVIPAQSCKCEWDTSCKLKYEISPDIVANANDKDTLVCRKHFYVDSCDSGSQTYKWEVSSSETKWVSNVDPSSVLNAAECENGDSVRTCGKQIVRLPAFSNFAFGLVVLILFSYYGLRKED